MLAVVSSALVLVFVLCWAGHPIPFPTNYSIHSIYYSIPSRLSPSHQGNACWLLPAGCIRSHQDKSAHAENDLMMCDPKGNGT
jgi:hypothetical protein